MSVEVTTHRTDEGQVEDGAQDRYSSDEAHHHWEEAPVLKKDKDRETILRFLSYLHILSVFLI